MSLGGTMTTRRILGRMGIAAGTLTAAVAAWAAPDPAAPAGELSAEVCAGKVTSEALVTEAIKRAKENAVLNAFVTLDEAGALAAARRIDAMVKKRHGKRCGALAGVPIVVKDNTHVAGLPSTAGTPALKDFVPKADAPVVRKLHAAGAIVLGKTNMHELAFGISGYNPTFQTGPEVGVRNAYDHSRSAGGSSSGTGAALGARIVGAGLGTDTGGSVRIPCAFNGCAALRPTVGRYSRAGIEPISHTRDTAGPMALAMSDIELLDRVITGARRARAADLRKVRLGVVKALLANMDSDTQQAFDAAVAKLKGAGVTVIEVDMPKLMELNAAVGFPVALYEAYDDVVAYLAKYRPGLTIQAMAERIASPDVKGTFQGLVIARKLPGPNNTTVDAKPAYQAAMKTARPAMRRLYAKTFRANRLDAIIFPTVPKVAMLANPESSSVPTFVAVIQNTDPGSDAGVPGLQLPIALGATTKLPIGMEFDGPVGSDRRLVSIGLAAQALLGRLPAPAAR
jgi:Asp-tRNA(Asn)/Glu-tRNA(Gln) amidotransferase A subunit family amidase